MKTAINTRTQEEYDALIEMVTKTDILMLNSSAWQDYREETCVNLGGRFVTYASRGHFQRKGYTIISYTEFSKTIKPEIDYKVKFEEAVKLLGDCLSINSVYEKDNYLLEEINQFLTNHKDGE